MRLSIITRNYTGYTTSHVKHNIELNITRCSCSYEFSSSHHIQIVMKDHYKMTSSQIGGLFLGGYIVRVQECPTNLLTGN